MVFDTMVFAYALLNVEQWDEKAIAVLESADRIIVPDSMFVELGNVVWQWVQFRQVSLHTGLEVLQDAEALVDLAIPSSHIRDLALELAVEVNHSFYDALFVAASIQANTQVATFDRKLAIKFPDRVSILQ
jgi:predicted nucleic acid-binding protein